jgi:transcriptional regulator with XRE-family HTH domain
MLIKELRRKKRVSQEQLAETCGLSLRTIQRVESGHRIGYASLRAIATTFDIDVDVLEQELYSIDKMAHQYKDFPLWVKVYLGRGWFTATRHEFLKSEI